jgi:predicted dithiol-disulfide oxidoreductase (DUF899 family)
MPPVVDLETWQAARAALLVREKAHTRAGDALAAERRRLPMVRVTTEHVLQGPDGPVRLLDLFEGRRQLIVYHHMLAPNDPNPCPGCSGLCDSIGRLEHLHAGDVTFAVVARAPFDVFDAFRRRMGWTFPIYSSAGSTFTEELNLNPHGPGSFGIGVFLRDGADIYLTYFTQGRGAEAIHADPGFLDLTPFGRQESFEDSPEGWPQEPTYTRGKLRDQYTDEELSGATMPSSAG